MYCFVDYAKAFDCVQFSSVAQLCLTLCDPMDCSMPGPPSITNSWSLLKPCPLSRWCHLTISSSVIPFSSCPQSFPASGSFPVSQLFTPGSQSIGTSAAVLLVSIQGWFPLRVTSLISFLSKELSRVFSSTTIGKCQFFGTQLSLWSNSHTHTWLLGKSSLWLHGLLSAKRHQRLIQILILSLTKCLSFS